MDRILLAINAAEPGKNALDFACYLAGLTKSRVTGVFLDNQAASLTPLGINKPAMAGADDSDAGLTAAEILEKNINAFRQGCINNEVTCAVHKHHGIPAEDMIKESRFADLIVADAETSFKSHFEGPPSEFVQDLLQKAECPVVIAPSSFDSIEEIVFAYNGSASSVFAIKQFTYLFPQFCHKKLSVVQANETGKWEDKQKHKLTEWLKGHYSDIHFEVLQDTSESALFAYTFQRKNMFLVIGAYGRNTISQFFKRSTADLLIKTITQPIFIAHH